MRLRFNLKTFLVVVSSFGVIFAWIGTNLLEHQREQQVLDQINATQNLDLVITNLRGDWQTQRQFIWG